MFSNMLLLAENGSCIIPFSQVPFCNPMMVASQVENIWIPYESESARKQLSESLWLSSGASGMKVWLTLQSEVCYLHMVLA